MKKPTAAYLYQDGHAIICFEQSIKIGGSYQTIEYVEVHEQWTKAPRQFTGRIVFHRYHAGAFLRLAKIAHVIECSVPTLERGSENTKARGLFYGSLDFTIDDGSCISIPTFSDGAVPSWNDSHTSICSAGYTYQPKCEAKFADTIAGSTWCNHPIAKIHRLPKSTEVESVAA